MMGINPSVAYLLLFGFFLSVFFYRRASRQRLPLQIFLILGAAIMLVIQRVAPLARVWMYLEAFYLLFAASGLVWLAEVLLNRLWKTENASRILSGTILMAVLILFADIYLATQRGSLIPNRDDFPEQYAAKYLASHLQADDTILSIAPVDIQTAYYLYMYGISYEVFYQRDHPEEVQNAIILLRTNSKYDTPESILNFFKISQDFDPSSARLIYEYGPIQIYSVLPSLP